MKLEFSKFSSVDRLFRLFESSPMSDRFFLKLLFFVIIGSGIWLALAYNNELSTTTPVRGGTVTEGIVGTPRFINPTLAITRADQDVTALVYSGLMRLSSNGELVNDIAESITLAEDGLTYNVVVRRDITFHDGTPLTARDVVYTLQLIQDPDLKSPLRANWTDVLIEQVNEYELNIVLEEAYAPFIQNFTVGILPAHLWNSLPIEQLPFSQLNTEPVGSGPFQVINALRDNSGVIEYYRLSAFRENYLEPKIDTIELSFYTNEKDLLLALQNKQIDTTTYLSLGDLSRGIPSGYRLVEAPLPRIFGVFFNQNRSPALRDDAARAALEAAVDRDSLITTTLSGFGVPIYGPTTLPLTTVESTDGIADTPTSTPTSSVESILTDGGWKRNDVGFWEKKIDGDIVTFEITLRTSNAPLLVALLNSLTEQWQAVGIRVNVEQFEQTGLLQSVIRPRDFQALVFGMDINRSHDLYSFWHSSQQNDPGLNVAQYANVEVDALLEKSRVEQDEAIRLESLTKANRIIAEEHPAIFLFQPTLPYLVKNEITLPQLTNLSQPSDRFSNITEWHIKSESLWPLFHNEDM